ncbi:MAG TPA: YidB family protein [Trebonia sp.]|jgi:uncharacterized protein YidB (DUF937 family)|nr:YidB family protein [Trebonia sp.]
MALGDILSKLGGQQGQQGGLATITRLLGGGNGLQGIMSKLNANGMGEQVKSWIGTGQNMPVSGADIKNVVDPQQLAQMAEQRDMSPDQMADQVAQALPSVVDKATPEGQVPKQGSSMDSLMGLLK